MKVKVSVAGPSQDTAQQARTGSIRGARDRRDSRSLWFDPPIDDQDRVVPGSPANGWSPRRWR